MLAVAHHVERRRVLRLQDCGKVESRIGVRRRDQRIDIVPLLRPHVAEQVRRNRAVRGHHAVAVFLAQAIAHVGVRGQVQRTNLLPQAVEFIGESVRRQVVLGAPHRARIVEPQLRAPLLASSTKRWYSAASARRWRAIPARPPATPSDRWLLARILLISSTSRQSHLPARAILAFAVLAFHCRGDFGQLRALGRIAMAPPWSARASAV